MLIFWQLRANSTYMLEEIKVANIFSQIGTILSSLAKTEKFGLIIASWSQNVPCYCIEKSRYTRDKSSKKLNSSKNSTHSAMYLE